MKDVDHADKLDYMIMEIGYLHKIIFGSAFCSEDLYLLKLYKQRAGLEVVNTFFSIPMCNPRKLVSFNLIKINLKFKILSVLTIMV